MMKFKFKTKMLNKSRRAKAFMCSQHEPTDNNDEHHNDATTINKAVNKKQQGFTLIELLVVVSILAALAGLASVAMGSYQQDSEEKITRVEMQRIANAIRRFKADTGYWPKTEAVAYSYGEYADPANFGFLFSQTGTSIPNWTPEYAIGWHGPYVNFDAMRTIALDSISSDGCDGATNTVIAGLDQFSYGLVDRFQQVRERNTGKDYCVLTRDENSPTEFKIAEFSASPYLYETAFTHSGSSICKEDISPPIDSTITCVALRSFGTDGIDNGGADVSDDIVFVLAVN